jgi:hypothetical protein
MNSLSQDISKQTQPELIKDSYRLGMKNYLSGIYKNCVS